MSQPFEYYQQNKLNYKSQIDQLQKRIRISSLIRLAVFISTGLLSYLFVANTYVLITILVFGIGLFTFLVLFHEGLVYKVIEDGIAQGAIPNKPIKHLLVGISATFNGALNMMWDGRAAEEFELTNEELVNVISQYMLAGITGLSCVSNGLRDE